MSSQTGFIGKSLVLTQFGKESFSVAVWMFCAMIVRWIVYWTWLENVIPPGFIFASPLLISVLKKAFPTVFCTPLLPIRLAEGIMGRVSYSKLGVSIPAHFAGCFIGIVLFRSIFPFVPLKLLQPVIYEDSNVLHGFLYEIVVSCLFVMINLVLPYVLDLNSVAKPAVLSLVTVPLMLISVGGSPSMFHPAAMYSLWFISNPMAMKPSSTTSVFSTINSVYENVSSITEFHANVTLENITKFEFSNIGDWAKNASAAAVEIITTSSIDGNAYRSLQPLHIMGQLLGGILAGVLYFKLFADDAQHWKLREDLHFTLSSSPKLSELNVIDGVQCRGVKKEVHGVSVVCK